MSESSILQPHPSAGPAARLYRFTASGWLVLLVAFGLLAWASVSALQTTVDTWLELPEYSHGILIPLVCAFLLWQRRFELAAMPFAGAWSGVLLALIGLGLHAAGRLSALLILQQYGTLLVLYGILLAAVGWRVFRQLWVPLLLLALAVPLPQFLLKNFSAQMQLLSSAIGVWFIRLFGISVFLEGNVIDLGVYKLQVAEACDGLRYLFPLMTLGLIMAYFYRAPLWKRLLVLLSSVPITILMNSFRIGVIGLTVQHWGIGMAEGFLHEFQGWVVFMASASLMVAEMALLSRLGARRSSLRQSFAIDLPVPPPRQTLIEPRAIPKPLLLLTGCLAVYGAFVQFWPERAEVRQARTPFAAFPLSLEPWSGQVNAMESVYLDALKLDDYLMADFYRSGVEPPVNFYVAWYDSQRAGQSAHSPRTCIPGGGWRITDLRPTQLGAVRIDGQPLRVNRVVIEHGSDRQLVYYWFQQRGRVVTNEYLVKWYILVDAIRRQRTDGAMVRLITPLKPGEDMARADGRLSDFAAAVAPRLSAYVPQ